MGILSKKRSDGILVRDVDPYAMLLPYVMRGRNESAVYYSKSIDITPALEFLADRKEQGDYITVFNLIIAAIKDAQSKAEARSKEEMGKLTASMGLPADMKLPF